MTYFPYSWCYWCKLKTGWWIYGITKTRFILLMYILAPFWAEISHHFRFKNQVWKDTSLSRNAQQFPGCTRLFWTSSSISITSMKIHWLHTTNQGGPLSPEEYRAEMSHSYQSVRLQKRGSAKACASESVRLRKRAPLKAGAWRSQAPAWKS